MLLHSDCFRLAAGTAHCDFMSKNVCPVGHAEKMFHYCCGTEYPQLISNWNKKVVLKWNFPLFHISRHPFLCVWVCVCICVYAFVHLCVCVSNTHIDYLGIVHCFQCIKIKLLWKTSDHRDLQLTGEKLRHRKIRNYIFSILRYKFWMRYWYSESCRIALFIGYLEPGC